MTHPIWHRPGRRPAEIRRILSDPAHEEFSAIAANLLSSVSEPEEIAKWIGLDLLARQYGPRIRSRIPENAAREAADLLVNILRKREGAPSRDPEPKSPRDPEMVALGRRLRVFRESAGLTAEEMARRRGVSRQRITEIESGRFQIAVRTMIDFIEAAGGAVHIDIRHRSDDPGFREKEKALGAYEETRAGKEGNGYTYAEVRLAGKDIQEKGIKELKDLLRERAVIHRGAPFPSTVAEHDPIEVLGRGEVVAAHEWRNEPLYDRVAVRAEGLWSWLAAAVEDSVREVEPRKYWSFEWTAYDLATILIYAQWLIERWPGAESAAILVEYGRMKGRELRVFQIHSRPGLMGKFTAKVDRIEIQSRSIGMQDDLRPVLQTMVEEVFRYFGFDYDIPPDLLEKALYRTENTTSSATGGR